MWLGEKRGQGVKGVVDKLIPGTEWPLPHAAAATRQPDRQQVDIGAQPLRPRAENVRITAGEWHTDQRHRGAPGRLAKDGQALVTASRQGARSLVLSGAGNGADSAVAENSGRDLSDRTLLDELFRSERIGAEFLLGPGHEAYYRKGRAACVEEIVIAALEGYPQLSTDVDNPLLDCSLAVRVARPTHLLTHREMETTDGAVNETIVVELIFTGHEDITESLEAGGAAELLKRIGKGVDAYRRRQVAAGEAQAHLVGWRGMRV